MGTIVERMTELGITLPPVVPPVAAYQPAVLDGDHVWTAGQIPVADGALMCTGLVGPSGVSIEDAAAAARVCALNALAAVDSVAGGLDRVAAIVKVTGYVASQPGFTDQPQVVDGASNLLGEIFGEAGKHARAAVGVAILPKDASVEVDLVVRLKS